MLIGGITQAADSSSITVGWTLPTKTITGGDCNVAGYTIPADKPIIVRVQWRVKGVTTWQFADTADRAVSYKISNLSPETLYEIRIGPHYGTGTVSCWSGLIQATTPGLEPPQGCSALKVLTTE
jgi:hypothetical protein